ncbi:hypothetical protein BC938DRAFT_481752 [Jimgerdemannia flammicorona]|uniref:Uncharacterized protein n=1 Tax=Jimgerdemannia flammicorona TaxID=994334 RepID=A0A433QG47_9FUNG|nr:hypothetical protein BC938DRAFT_481752 [Jimgerdemannia flammicorona]
MEIFVCILIEYFQQLNLAVSMAIHDPSKVAHRRCPLYVGGREITATVEKEANLVGDVKNDVVAQKPKPKPALPRGHRATQSAGCYGHPIAFAGKKRALPNGADCSRRAVC